MAGEVISNIISDAEAQPEAQPTVQLALSNMLFSAGDFFGGVDTLRKNLQIIETPLHSDLQSELPIFPGRYDLTPTRMLIVDDFLRRITSADATGLNQAWATPPARAIRNAWAGRSLDSAKGGLLNLVYWGALPEQRGSLQTIHRMNERLGGVRETVYGQQPDAKGKFIDFTARRDAGILVAHQVQPEGFRRLGDVRAHNVSLLARGVGGLIIDCHHIQREDLDAFGILRSIKETEMPIVGFHVSAGRVDAKTEADRKRSRGDLAALYEGPETFAETEAGKILRRSYATYVEQWQAGILPAQMEGPVPAVLEIADKGLTTYCKGQHIRPTRAKKLQMIRHLGQSTNAFFENLRVSG